MLPTVIVGLVLEVYHKEIMCENHMRILIVVRYVEYSTKE